MTTDLTVPSWADLCGKFIRTEFYLSNGYTDSYANGTVVMQCPLCGAFTDEGDGMAAHWSYHTRRGEPL